MARNITLASIIFFLLLQASAGFCAESLLEAAKKGDEAAVKTLLANGAEVDMRGELGKTPLMLAADKGHLSIAELLIKNGADVNAKNDLDWTALMFAAATGSTPIVRLLLEKGADPNALSRSYYTALILASGGGYPEIVELLLKDGADRVPKKNGMTARQWAEKLNHKEVLKVFDRFSKKP